MPVQFSPRIGQAVPPDIMVRERIGRERQGLQTGGRQQGGLDAIPILKPQGLSRQIGLRPHDRIGQPRQRPDGDHILLETPDQLGVSRNARGVLFGFEPERNVIRRPIYDGGRLFLQKGALRIPAQQYSAIVFIPHQSEGVQTTIQRTNVIDATLCRDGIERRTEVPIALRIRHDTDL